jgi:transposase
MRFEDVYEKWSVKRLTQEEGAQLLGVCDRTFRRYIDRYEEAGMEGLMDKRMNEVSHRQAPVDEVFRLEALYKERYDSWNVQHFYGRYQGEHGGERSYTWVKNRLQLAGLVTKGKRKDSHRKRRERAPLAGMMIHQDGSTHEWVLGKKWDLIVTMDDATNEIYSAFFVDEEGTLSSFRGVGEVLKKRGLFSSFYSDRGSHYWHTPEAGGKVDKTNPTQFGRALGQLGIQMIAAYSPQARGRSERIFKTWQDRLPKELALADIDDMAAANRFLDEQFTPAYNTEFQVTAAESGSAFVPLLDTRIEDILCVQEERTVGRDNCVKYQRKILQIPADQHRCHYVKARVRVHEYPNGHTAIFHGPRKLAEYDSRGQLIGTEAKQAAA